AQTRGQFLDTKLSAFFSCCSIETWSFDVRFGSLADIAAALPNVRFTPKSGHHRTPLSCPLSAKPGSRKLNQNHWNALDMQSAPQRGSLCCNCLRRKGNTAWATAPGSSANGQCPLSGKIFISARGKT